MPVVTVLALVAFLNSGDVWTVPASGGTPVRVTRTGGLVEDFRFSPQGRYLAYSRRIRQAEERPVASIVVIRVDTGAVLTEIRPREGWIDIDRWLGTTLMYHSSAAGEVSGVYEYDAARGTTRRLEPQTEAIAFNRDLSPDGRLLAYVDDTGLGPAFQERLHLVAIDTGADEVHLSRRSVMAPAIAPDKAAVAFLEVVGDLRDWSSARDRVWVYRLGAGESMIYDGPVRAKGGGSALIWSRDGRMLAMNFGGRTVVLSAFGNDMPRDLQGTDACWTENGQLVLAASGGVDAVDVASGGRRALIARATRPQCLGADALAR